MNTVRRHSGTRVGESRCQNITSVTPGRSCAPQGATVTLLPRQIFAPMRLSLRVCICETRDLKQNTKVPCKPSRSGSLFYPLETPASQGKFSAFRTKIVYLTWKRAAVLLIYFGSAAHSGMYPISRPRRRRRRWQGRCQPAVCATRLIICRGGCARHAWGESRPISKSP